MRKLFLLALLCCCSLASAQAPKPKKPVKHHFIDCSKRKHGFGYEKTELTGAGYALYKVGVTRVFLIGCKASTE